VEGGGGGMERRAVFGGYSGVKLTAKETLGLCMFGGLGGDAPETKAQVAH